MEAQKASAAVIIVSTRVTDIGFLISCWARYQQKIEEEFFENFRFLTLKELRK